MSKHPSLADRIAAALTARTSSADVAALRAEVETASAAAIAAATEAKTKALDARLTGAQVAAARSAASEAEFERDRLAAAAESLSARLTEVRRREEDEHQRREREAFAAKCDGLAARLADSEPEIVRFASLMAEIEQVDGRNVFGHRAHIAFGASPFFKALLAGDSLVIATMARVFRQRAAGFLDPAVLSNNAPAVVTPGLTFDEMYAAAASEKNVVALRG